MAAACEVFPAANARALKFKFAHDPWAILAGGASASVRDSALSDLEATIATADATIEAGFPGGSGATWPIAGRCLVSVTPPASSSSPDGLVGAESGAVGNSSAYFGRGTLAAWYNPAPLLGSPLAGKVWRAASDGAPPNPPVPMWTDMLIGVDGFAVIMIVLLVVVAVLIASRVPSARAAAARLRDAVRHPRTGMPAN